MVERPLRSRSVRITTNSNIHQGKLIKQNCNNLIYFAADVDFEGRFIFHSLSELPPPVRKRRTYRPSVLYAVSGCVKSLIGTLN